MGTFRDDVVRGARKVMEVALDRSDQELNPKGTSTLLETTRGERRVLARTAELFRFKALNQPGGSHSGQMPTNAPLMDRVAAASQAQRAYVLDANAGQYVDLYIAFVLGRGGPTVNAPDPEVQERLDATTSDALNEGELTSFEALREKAVDWLITANVYLLIFDDGWDGIARVSSLPFDAVEDRVRHKLQRSRTLFYKVIERPVEWSYTEDAYVSPPGDENKVVYYESIDAFPENNPAAEAQDEALGGRAAFSPPPHRMRPGKVLHLCGPKTSDMAFAVTPMQRFIRWWSAYNDVLSQHVKRMEAIAKLIMTATVDGDQATLDRIAAEAMSGNTGAFQFGGEFTEGADLGLGPAPAPQILGQNSTLKYDALRLSSNTAELSQMMGELRSTSSGMFPTSWYGGDADGLSGEQMKEQPGMKWVEAEQKMWERAQHRLYQASIDASIRTGHLKEWRPPTEGELEVLKACEESGEALPFEVNEFGDVKRDLSFTVTCPSPLKRAMGDLIQGAVAVASAADPQGQNPEITRWLLSFCFAEAFDIENPGKLVDEIFPKHLARQMAQQARDQAEAATLAAQNAARPPAPDGTDKTTGADGKKHPSDNPGGAPQKSPNPEDRKPAREAAHAEAARARDLNDSFGTLAATADDLLAQLDRVDDAALAGLVGA